MMKIRNWLFLLRTKYRCHVCHRDQPVVALATNSLYDDEYGWLPADEDKSLFILSDVCSAPAQILELVRSSGAKYEKRKNSDREDTCFTNWCTDCGAILRDLYLVGLPSGPFCPKTIEDASAIELSEIPLASELEFDCDYVLGEGEIIRQPTREHPKISPFDDSQW